MKKSLLNIILLLIAVTLTACSINHYQQVSTSTPSTPGVQSDVTGGQVLTQRSSLLHDSLPGIMDENDKSKMLHALDKSPGKSTSWVNPTSGIRYTVVPTQKVVIGANPYCRKYLITTNKNESRNQYTGTACVGQDGNWNTI